MDLKDCSIDEKTLYRYRAGVSTPTDQRLRHIEQIRPGTKRVFYVGPDEVPLWEAMWGTTPLPCFADLVQADVLPGGRLPLYVALNLSKDEAVLWFRRVIAEVLDADQREKNLQVSLMAALFLNRWHSNLGSAINFDRYSLIRLLIDEPELSAWLESFGIRKLLVDFADQRAQAAEFAINRQPLPVSIAEQWIEDLGPILGLERGRRYKFGEAFCREFAESISEAMRGTEFEAVAQEIRYSTRNESTTIADAVIELGDEVLSSQVRIPLEHLH